MPSIDLVRRRTVGAHCDPPPGRSAGPRREERRVVGVIRAIVFGMACLLDRWVRRSTVSNTI